jgi:hypothetical protein
MPNVIGIIGSRRRDTTEDFEATYRAFTKIYRKGDTIVSGGCPKGGDRFAEVIAMKENVPIRLHRADWKGLGRKAGFARNGLIARDATVLIACVSADRTGGTEDTIRKFQKLHPDGVLILV